MNNGNLIYFLRHLKRRHRVSVTDESGREVWYTFATSLRWGLYALLATAVVFVIAVLISAYTNILNVVPGYDGIEARERSEENIVRLDSLERELSYIRAYTENVAMIMEGRSPVVRSLTPTEQERISSDKELVAPSALDSLLREQLEGDGRYGLNTSGGNVVSKPTHAAIINPVEGGSVVGKFSPTSGKYGVRLSVPSARSVVAVQDGTVVLSVYEMDGYTVQIQHAGNFISTYRGLGQAHKAVGNKVKGGEAIGSTWEAAADADEVELQLWFDGVAVDPENYITF